MNDFLSVRQCQRCHDDHPVGLIMSKFNTQMICGPCKDKEKAHPKYAEADRLEVEAVRAGNHNYPGIGLPDDLA